MDKFWKWIAGILPCKLVFFAALRAVNARKNTEGTWEIDDDRKTTEHLNRWRSYMYEQRVWWHSQNLTNGKKPMWKHGRGWLHLWSGRIGIEWSVGSSELRCQFSLNAHDERDLSLSLGLPSIGLLWISFEHFIPARWLPGYWAESSLYPGEKFWMPVERTTGFYFFEKALWISIWRDGTGWVKDKPWQWIVIHFDDLILGKAKYSTEELSKADAVVHLPEGDYPVTVTMERATWKRPRWPKPTEIIRANIEAVDRINGIPSHAGKGENPWDLDDDALYSSTLPANTPEEAVQKVTKNILQYRERYGKPAVAWNH